MARDPVRVLGVDTSLRSSGVAIVEAADNRFQALSYGTIRNPQSRRHSQCLQAIYKAIEDLLERYHPDCVAVEGIFFCKNVKTAVILGQARGAVLAACGVADVPVYEYAPRRVKQSVVGSGRAHKDQVGMMMMSMLKLPKLPQNDEADAMAIALCHLHSTTGVSATPPQQI